MSSEEAPQILFSIRQNVHRLPQKGFLLVTGETAIWVPEDVPIKSFCLESQAGL